MDKGRGSYIQVHVISMNVLPIGNNGRVQMGDHHAVS